MRPILLLWAASIATVASSQCTCDPGVIQINQGTTPVDIMFVPVTFTPSSDGCDLTVNCAGYSPLAIGTYYSSTVQGDSPILDMANVAILADSSGTDETSLDFNSMRCVNGNWIPYIANIDYLAVNDPNDPSQWIAYNNIFCIHGLPPSAVTDIVTSSTMTFPISQPTTTKNSNCPCLPESMQINQGTPSETLTFAPVTFTTSAEGCDLTVHCTGYSPLAIGTYYSSTVQGDSPILDLANVALLADSSPTGGMSLDFNSMRCVNGNWIPYIADNDYLAVNDPNDPSQWITYNNIFCIRPQTSQHPVSPEATKIAMHPKGRALKNRD